MTSTDILYINGVVHSVDSDIEDKEGIEECGWFACLNQCPDELRKKYPAAHIIDLQKHHVFPGFIDSHVHLAHFGRYLGEADLTGALSPTEVVFRLIEHAKRYNLTGTDNETWIVAKGWDQTLFPDKKFPTRFDLDDAFPDRPVMLLRTDVHAVWINSALLRKIDLPHQDPEGGQIIRNENGDALGVFIDKAVELVNRQAPKILQETVKEWQLRAARECVKYGLTGVHDAALSTSSVEGLRSLASNGLLPLRVYGMLDSEGLLDFTPDNPDDLLKYWKSHGPLVDSENCMVTVRAVKLFVDGALGSRGAALLSPYCDCVGHKGLFLISVSRLENQIMEWMRAGFQVCTHAIGDAGNRLVLDSYIKAMHELGKDIRPRVEHAQIVSFEDIRKFRDYHVIASVQPTHCTSDMTYAEDRLGKDRIQDAYAWKRFQNNGVRLALGSDLPVEHCNPLLGFYAAVTRQDSKGNPDEGFYPDERLSRLSALRGFTIDGAYASFKENEVGSIESGKWADFVVLSQDIMTVPYQEIISTKVLKTVMGGRVVYELKID